MKGKIELYVSLVFILYVAVAGTSISLWGFSFAGLGVLYIGAAMATTFAFIIMNMGLKKDNLTGE